MEEKEEKYSSDNPPCVLAYYKRRWVAVPLAHVPKSAIKDNGTIVTHEFIYLDEKTGEPLPQQPKPSPRRENGASDKIWVSVKEKIIPEKWSEKDLRQLCRNNDIHLPWVTDRFPEKPHRSSGNPNRRKERKVRSLTSKEFNQLRKEVRKSSEPIAVVISILWFLNTWMKKAGIFVTLEEILRMRIGDVFLDEECASHCIQLSRRRMNRSQLVSHWLPSRLWKAVCRQINENSMFIFSNRNGAPLLPVQVDSHLRNAAKRIGFNETITSLSLRTGFNKKEVERAAEKYQAKISLEKYLDPISSEEWDEVCKCIPSIMKRRGRRSIHEPLSLLNAILYHLKTGCPIRKLPLIFPPGSAVHSQYTRWKKAGILEKFFDFGNQKELPNSTTKLQLDPFL